MTTLTLKRRNWTDEHGCQMWAVGGPDGAIAWGIPKPGAYSPIEIHSPRPRHGHNPVGEACQVLEMQCYFDADCMSGSHLGDHWDESGRDDRVIWVWLEAAYRSYLDGAS
jgi:hypothetical protein